MGIRAVSLNYRDIMIVNGHYGRGKPKDLVVPTSDGAGEVVAVGPGVTRFGPGDRVVASFMQSWIGGGPQSHYNDSALGASIDGVLREQAVFHENGLVAIPSDMTFEEAATFPCAGVTAWHCLFEDAGVKAGQTLLTQGGGGVSIFCLQMAATSGLNVIAMSSSLNKTETMRKLGASETINYRDDPDWERRCLELTSGRGVDHIVHVTGSDQLERSLSAVAYGGSVHLVGPGGSRGIRPALITRRLVKLRGIHVGSRTMLERLLDYYTTHGLRPIIDRVFGFDEARLAYEYLQSGSHLGKVVISVP